MEVERRSGGGGEAAERGVLAYISWVWYEPLSPQPGAAQQPERMGSVGDSSLSFPTTLSVRGASRGGPRLAVPLVGYLALGWVGLCLCALHAKRVHMPSELHDPRSLDTPACLPAGSTPTPMLSGRQAEHAIGCTFFFAWYNILFLCMVFKI